VRIDTLPDMARTVVPTRRSLVLRPMAVRDVASVARIDARAFGAGGWPESAFLAELRKNRLARYFVVAMPGSETETPDELLGYIGCWVVADAVHIVTVGVDPGFQRQGIGDLLVVRAMELAWEAGVSIATLECRASNFAAQALYRKYGFDIAGRRRRYYSDDEDALIMTASEMDSNDFCDRVATRRAEHAVRHGITLKRIGG
jgi:ribosomal-protein-alanine N-acetyltransferase